jgi:Flp pilus assembly protein TadD
MASEPPDVAKAVAVYRKLLERDANDVLALNNLACTMILPNSGFSAKDALEFSTRAFRIVEQTGGVNAYIFDTQGQILILNGRFQEGVSLLQRAIDKEPIAEACFHLGEAYLSMPEPRIAEAQDALKQAQALQEAAVRDNKPVDSDLKSRIEKALERSRQPVPTAAK